jgi:uncharacterized membrane protein YcgQ (UPF0703/DUF1980 family)
MKKLVLTAVMLCLALALPGCREESGAKTEIKSANAEIKNVNAETKDADTKTKNADTEIDADVEIKEKMFIAQTNEIYLNLDDYLGKTIKYEGFFSSETFPENGVTYHYVIRNGPGCCPGIDNTAGFEVDWTQSYPKSNEWVEAVGVLEKYDEDGAEYVRLALSSLTVLPERGEDYVMQ